MSLFFLDSFLVNDAVPTMRLGGGAFAIGLRGPAALPSSDDVMLEAFEALGIDPSVVIEASISQQADGMNVLMVAAKVLPLPERGDVITVAGVPLQIAYVQQMPVDLSSPEAEGL